MIYVKSKKKKLRIRRKRNHIFGSLTIRTLKKKIMLIFPRLRSSSTPIRRSPVSLKRKSFEQNQLFRRNSLKVYLTMSPAHS